MACATTGTATTGRTTDRRDDRQDDDRQDTAVVPPSRYDEDRQDAEVVRPSRYATGRTRGGAAEQVSDEPPADDDTEPLRLADRYRAPRADDVPRVPQPRDPRTERGSTLDRWRHQAGGPLPRPRRWRRS